MEEWIKVVVPLIAVAGLWWKITTSMATKDDMSKQFAEIKADIREIRQMLFTHVSDREKHEGT
jgi:hypothetical protein